MISVEEALSRLLSLAAPMKSENIPLRGSSERVLAKDIVATTDQPPFATSAMDGYAVAISKVVPGNRFTVIGEAAAGHVFTGELGGNNAVRIFTGAPVPDGTKRIIIQEDVDRSDNEIILRNKLDKSNYVRPAGGDFQAGHKVYSGKKLKPADIALLASMNNAYVEVSKRPIIALISTGDELVSPGEPLGEGQIVASNAYGLTALFENNGAIVRLLPITQDNITSLKAAFELCKGANLIVTIGGASVGEHDLVYEAAIDKGLKQSFYKVSMRPGKPLMAGRLGNIPVVGLPGNPVSAIVCGHLFIVPMIKSMLGLSSVLPKTFETVLLNDLAENGKRKHYCRATLSAEGLYVAERQDSSLLTILSAANALAIREPNAPPARKGDKIMYIPI